MVFHHHQQLMMDDIELLDGSSDEMDMDRYSGVTFLLCSLALL